MQRFYRLENKEENIVYWISATPEIFFFQNVNRMLLDKVTWKRYTPKIFSFGNRGRKQIFSASGPAFSSRTLSLVTRFLFSSAWRLANALGCVYEYKALGFSSHSTTTRR